MEHFCVFCKIASGAFPCYKIYEDDLFFGFLDIHPRVVGHSILIPKKHYQWVYDVPEFEQYWKSVLVITHVMKKALSPAFITYLTHGLEIPHAHIHILPRTQEKEFVPCHISVNEEKMKRTAQLLHSFNRRNDIIHEETNVA